jgi:hypothetical protein
VAIHTLNPLEDRRWIEFIGKHPNASIVHTPGWLAVLKQTYGYEPVVYTTTPEDSALRNGAVFCRVSSWLTGRRLVSLPFTDHCGLLVDRAQDYSELIVSLQAAAASEKLEYVEIRSLDTQETPVWSLSAAFPLHTLDLRPSLDSLLRAAHKTAIQQAIRRAERERLSYEAGRSAALVNQFYRLLLLTRRRHRIPPQPLQWFTNLVTELGDRVTVRVASKDGRPVASIVTLQWRDAVLYKYGCSDAALHNLGGMAFLLWKTIQEAKETGANVLDFGRSDPDNAGLITFKDRWGARQTPLKYIRFSTRPLRSATDRYGARFVRSAFARMPDAMLAAAGRMLYKHIG